MRTGRNLLAGVLGSLLTTLVGLAVVPLYLKYLGIEAYGVIGFFMTTQALLQLLDMGISPTVNREVARCSASGSMDEARTVLRTIEWINWATATALAMLIVIASGFISSRWLRSNQLGTDELASAVKVMALVVALRWPVALYQAALVGMHRVDVSSSVSVAMAVLTNLGAVAVLANVSADLKTFFAWQAGMAVIYLLIMRQLAWRTIGGAVGATFSVSTIKRLWRFSLGLSGIAVSALVLTQLDKVLLSKLLPLSEFGQYMLATTIAGGFSLVIYTPAFNVVYPLFSSLVAKQDDAALRRAYRTGTRLLVTALFPLVLIIGLLAPDLLLLWTRDARIAAGVAPLLTLLALGAAFHGIMYFPYALQLAAGTTRLPLKINGLLLLIMVPLIAYLAPAYGATGGALAWVALNLLYVPLGTWMTHRTLLPGLGSRWLFVDVGIPALLSAAVAAVGAVLLHMSDSLFARLAIGVTCAAVSATLSFVLSPTLREALRVRLLRSNRALAPRR